MAGICAQMPTPGLSCSLEWLCFRSSPVWCKNPKNNEFRTKKFPNQEFLYGISSFCTLSENNSFLHGKISCFCIFLAEMVFLIQTDLPGWQMASAMSHAIHKIVSKRRCQSYFISRRSPHHGISKDSDLCASAHRCPHYAYARLIARVNSQVTSTPGPASGKSRLRTWHRRRLQRALHF